MNRFLLFAGDTYYPGGGWKDFKGGFPTLEDAVRHAAGKKWDWWQVVDLESGEIANEQE